MNAVALLGLLVLLLAALLMARVTRRTTVYEDEREVRPAGLPNGDPRVVRLLLERTAPPR